MVNGDSTRDIKVTVGWIYAPYSGTVTSLPEMALVFEITGIFESYWNTVFLLIE